MRLSRILTVGIALAAVIAGAWWYATQRPLAVPVAAVMRDVPIRVFGLGTIEAQVLSRVGFEVPGTLVEVLVDHGDEVAEGTVLARLNPASQQARVAKAEAAVLSAEAAAALAPEAAVMMAHVIEEAGGPDALLRLPAFAVTPLAHSRRVVGMDGSYLLGFGPRAAHARRDLARLLHPGAAVPDLPARVWT
ncbi:MAG: biotin/lipoyl-binding protein [Elioraea tepidiphila]